MYIFLYETGRPYYQNKEKLPGPKALQPKGDFVSSLGVVPFG